MNCLISDNCAGAIADTVEEGLVNGSLREKITQDARQQIAASHSDWDAEAERVFQYILAQA